MFTTESAWLMLGSSRGRGREIVVRHEEHKDDRTDAERECAAQAFVEHDESATTSHMASDERPRSLTRCAAIQQQTLCTLKPASNG